MRLPQALWHCGVQNSELPKGQALSYLVCYEILSCVETTVEEQKEFLTCILINTVNLPWNLRWNLISALSNSDHRHDHRTEFESASFFKTAFLD